MVAVARTVGGLEELDDEIKAAGGSATLVPLDLKDTDGIARLALALNERYGRLDVLIGNAGILGPLSPLGHVEPKDWDESDRGQCHRQLAAHPLHGPAAQAAPRRPRGVPHLRGRATRARAYWGPYAASKAALDALVRTYAAECATTNVRVNLFTPGPTRTRMYLRRLSRRRSDDAADAGRGRESDRAAVPAGLLGERQDLRLPHRASSWNSARRLKVSRQASARPFRAPAEDMIPNRRRHPEISAMR